MQVKIFKEKVKTILERRGSAEDEDEETSDEQSIAKMFEEVKEMVRELPERVDERVASLSRRGPFRRRWFHPMMLEELIYHPAFHEFKGGQAIALLVFLSFVREDMPWLYEPGIELYHAIRRGKQPEIAKARENLKVVSELTMRSDFLHEIMRGEDKESIFMLRHLDEFVHRIIGRIGS